jgi:hypothetical protein
MTNSPRSPKQSETSEQLCAAERQSITDLETIAAIRVGLQQVREGKAIPARAALSKLAHKLGI